MKNRRKKLAVLLLAFAMAGISSAGGFCTPGALTVMAGTTEGPIEDAAKEGETDETEAKEAEDAAPVPEAGEEPQVTITISAPENWQKEKAVVTVTAEDARQTGSFSVAKMEAKISEDGNWTDITSSKSIEVSKNSSVYVKVTDQNGKIYTGNRYIDSFDTTKPTLSAAAKDGVLVIRGEDADSGVAAIYVNGNEFTELTDNTLKVRLQQADTAYEYFTLQARDKAGNMSENYKVANPYYGNPEDKKPEANSSTAATGSATGNAGASTNTLPSDAAASKPTSATGTVAEHTESTDSGGREMASDTASDTAQTSNGGFGAAREGGKEFYTITTKGDKVFYLIVDKDKTSDNVYLLTEVGENDLLNFTDGNTVTLPQNAAVTESALPDEEVLETEEIKAREETEEEEEKEPEKSSNAGTYVLIVLVLLGVGGAYYYLKFIKGGKDSFEAGYDDEEEDGYDGEYETEIKGLDESEEYEPDGEESGYEGDTEDEDDV